MKKLKIMVKKQFYESYRGLFWTASKEDMLRVLRNEFKKGKIFEPKDAKDVSYYFRERFVIELQKTNEYYLALSFFRAYTPDLEKDSEPAEAEFYTRRL